MELHFLREEKETIFALVPAFPTNKWILFFPQCTMQQYRLALPILTLLTSQSKIDREAKKKAFVLYMMLKSRIASLFTRAKNRYLRYSGGVYRCVLRALWYGELCGVTC